MSGGGEVGEGNFPHQKTFQKFPEHLHEKQLKVEEEFFFSSSQRERES
jgi:hypothetical protein